MRYCNICNTKNYITKLFTFNLILPSEINLNNTLEIYYCNKCNFYYSDSNNNQIDYDNYYLKFNNYSDYTPSNNKDELCYNFISNYFNEKIKTILDFGCGNKFLANKLKNNFETDTYDIGMEKPNKKYDMIILSHVLEHIYDIDIFLNSIESQLNELGYIYIEVPNADYYNLLTDICPLQEINIEHINFFTKYSLNKLMIKHSYYSCLLTDDYFYINSKKYYVIRGIFQKYNNNKSFESYINYGTNIINSIKYENINNLYLYGCGQFLYKIFPNIINCNIINIVDDNKSLLNKKINNIEIINYEILKEKIKDNDSILITSMIGENSIRKKIETLNKKINILTLNIS